MGNFSKCGYYLVFNHRGKKNASNFKVKIWYQVIKPFFQNHYSTVHSKTYHAFEEALGSTPQHEENEKEKKEEKFCCNFREEIWITLEIS